MKYWIHTYITELIIEIIQITWFEIDNHFSQMIHGQVICYFTRSFDLAWPDVAPPLCSICRGLGVLIGYPPMVPINPQVFINPIYSHIYICWYPLWYHHISSTGLIYILIYILYSCITKMHILSYNDNIIVELVSSVGYEHVSENPWERMRESLKSDLKSCGRASYFLR